VAYYRFKEIKKPKCIPITMRPGLEERFAFFSCFGSEKPSASPDGGKTALIKEPAGEEPSGSSTWWRKRGASFHLDNDFYKAVLLKETSTPVKKRWCPGPFTRSL
jgi:hypothetical protein